jgi:transcriptional regulator GlxA family with amidase domain
VLPTTPPGPLPQCRLALTACPSIRVEDDPIVQDGSAITSAGVTAGIDLALHLVDVDLDADVARRVVKELVVFMARPGGQARFSQRAPRPTAIRRVLDHVAADLAAEHTVESLGGRRRLSRRHLSRLFRSEIGVSPGQYVESVRVEAARALLETSFGSVEDVARQAAFRSSQSLRRVFQQALGVSPTTYRASFRSTVPGAAELPGAHRTGGSTSVRG